MPSPDEEKSELGTRQARLDLGEKLLRSQYWFRFGNTIQRSTDAFVVVVCYTFEWYSIDDQKFGLCLLYGWKKL